MSGRSYDSRTPLFIEDIQRVGHVNEQRVGHEKESVLHEPTGLNYHGPGEGRRVSQLLLRLFQMDYNPRFSELVKSPK